jgi:hypothetical protein
MCHKEYLEDRAMALAGIAAFLPSPTLNGSITFTI